MKDINNKSDLEVVWLSLQRWTQLRPRPPQLQRISATFTRILITLACHLPNLLITQSPAPVTHTTYTLHLPVWPCFVTNHSSDVSGFRPVDSKSTNLSSATPRLFRSLVPSVLAFLSLFRVIFCAFPVFEIRSFVLYNPVFFVLPVCLDV